MDNVSFGVTVARVAGGERQEALSGCYAGLSGDGFDDFYLVGLHDFVAVDGVGVVAVFGTHVDVVAFGEQVDVVEDFTAGLAVACEGEVANLSGHGASLRSGRVRGESSTSELVPWVAGRWWSDPNLGM